MRHAGNDAEQDEDAGGQAEHARRGEELLHDLPADVFFLADTRDDHGRCNRDQQAWNLRDQRIAHSQKHVGVGGLADRQTMLQHADGEAADHADDQNQNAGHRVAAHELGGTVHRAEKVGFFGHFETAASRFFLVDIAGVEVGIDCHLLARHRVQGEARRHFGDALRTLGHHHEVDHHQDRENDQTDREIATDQEVAEGFDHRAGSAGTGVAFEQHDPCRGHVERQPHQRGEQQYRRECREVQRPHHVRGDHHHHQRDGDIDGEESVEQPGRNRQHHQAEDGDDEQWRRGALEHRALRTEPLADQVRIHSVPSTGCFGFLGCLGVLFSGSSSGGTKGSGTTSGIGASPRSAAFRRYT